MSVEAKLEAIESKIGELESQKKDFWDIFQIVATALIPLAIAFAGNEYAKAMKAAEIRSTEIVEKGKAEIEDIRVKVEQVGAVTSLLDALVSDNEIKRKLAVEAVLIALTVDGPKLVKIVEEKDDKPGVRVTAEKALESRRMILIQQLFDDVPTVRKNAYQALIGTWRSDSSLPKDLIEFARDNKDNHNGVYNTLVLLSHMDADALRPSVSEIEEFSREVEGIGPKTKERAEKLRVRLPK